MGDSRKREVTEKHEDVSRKDASDKLRQEAQEKPKSNPMSDYGVDRDRVGSKDDYTIFTQYPNGVRMARMEQKGVLKAGGSYELEPPPGGKREDQKDGSVLVKDANNKVLAKLDADKTLHVFTKNGEYTETKEGKVQFKPADGVTNIKSLHKDGAVSPKNYEDYGISAHGKVTRFPNGLEIDRATGNYKIPEEKLKGWSEHANVKKDHDDQGHLTKVTVTGADGKVLFWKDSKGYHVPTKDGVLHQKADGSVSFESSQTAAANKALPKVEIAGKISDPSRKKGSDDVLTMCKDNPDPLCGLEELTGKR